MPLSDEIEELITAYAEAYRAGDAQGCAAVYTPDALLVSPYAPTARGREAIRALHADWTAGGSPDKQIEVLEFGGSGDLAWCVARFAEGEADGEGTSLNILERQPGGGWLIRMCSLTETGAPHA